MQSTGGNILGKMDALYDMSLKNGSRLYEISDEIVWYWEKCKPIYSILNNHEELEQADGGIKKIAEYALCDDFNALRAELVATRSVIENMINAHIITFENVF